MNEALRKTHAIESARMEQLALAFTAACGIAITSGILASLIYLLLALSSLVLVRPAIAQSVPVKAGVLLESGIEKEGVAGDLKPAMDIYERVAADKSSPRDVRSRALLRLAGCDERIPRRRPAPRKHVKYASKMSPEAKPHRLQIVHRERRPLF